MRIGLAVIIGAEVNLVDNFIKQNRLSEIFTEIRFLCDKSEDGTVEKLKEYEAQGLCKVYQRALDFNFAEQRNHLNTFMEFEYILRLDIDEIMNEELINWIKNFNGDSDIYTVKRQEKFEGIVKTYTPIIFLYRNKPEIRWRNRIHEVIVGYKTKGLLDDGCLIVHDKDDARCNRQNNFYYSNFKEQRQIVDGG